MVFKLKRFKRRDQFIIIILISPAYFCGCENEYLPIYVILRHFLPLISQTNGVFCRQTEK